MTMTAEILSQGGVRLRPLVPQRDAKLAVPWYADPEVLQMSEESARPYDVAKIRRMYLQLAEQGEVYLIEVREGERWVPVGDAALSPDDLPIVIGPPEYRSRGIGARVLDLLLRRAGELGWRSVQAKRVLIENQRARRMFLSRGFWIDGVETGDGGRRYFRFRLRIGQPRNPWEHASFVRQHNAPSLERAEQRTSAETDWLVRALGACPGGRLLDLGCGLGRHARELARRGFAVVGVDVSAEVLAIARKRAAEAGLDEKVRFVQADMRTLDRIAEFDHAYSLFESGWGLLGDDLAHLDFLRRVRRALKTGGRLALASRNLYRWVSRGHSRLDLLTGRLPWTFRAGAGEPEGPYELGEMIRGFTPPEVALMARLAGFRPLSFSGVSLSMHEIRPFVSAEDVEHIGVLEALPESAPEPQRSRAGGNPGRCAAGLPCTPYEDTNSSARTPASGGKSPKRASLRHEKPGPSVAIS